MTRINTVVLCNHSIKTVKSASSVPEYIQIRSGLSLTRK